MNQREPAKATHTLPAFYAIYVEGIHNGPLSGQQGYLTQDGKCLFFSEKDTAELKVKDIESRCVSKSPTAMLRVVPFPRRGTHINVLDLESIIAHDLKLEAASLGHQARGQVYGSMCDSGMAGMVSLPC